ncbi:hypothetical protein PPERSA_03799 [Pseudocohnilembus persalinus]|uniref:Spindle pole body component n=1 Tax=Pseudocohnilembus persalinus TaxID=266149 RepID=A0A0V0QUL6_PSEPJ|nr:hypothetical protein PPERSA_03799 [Pseudocohnilembus persalinus]|eukprot:KRX05862.1 hypothetical protein PPERSA_03799 [Pseudocohnilembus persalinus]
MCYEILESNWQTFVQNLNNNVKNFEDIIQFHDQFLDNCLKECMLLEPNLLKIVCKLNDICKLFTQIMQNFTSTLKLNTQTAMNNKINSRNEEQNILDEQKQYDIFELRRLAVLENEGNLKKMITQQSYTRVIESFENKFDQSLKELMIYLNNQLTKQDSHLVNLVSRLDFDGFYQGYLGINTDSELIQNSYGQQKMHLE